MKTGATRGDRERQRGQGLVEFALIIPMILLLIASVAELGVVFGNQQSLSFASREGARVGAALARGDASACDPGATPPVTDPSNVDGVIAGAVQRIIKSPDSGIKMSQIQEIRIFKATTSGTESGGLVNVWRPPDPFVPGQGDDVDPGSGSEFIDFIAPGTVPWPACNRVNSGTPSQIESIGVTVKYTYEFVMPIAAVINSIAGGRLSVTLSETTVMALNPTIN